MPTINQQPPALPYNPLAAATNQDYVAKTLKARRLQALADSLTQQGASPIDYDPKGRISPWQGVSKMLAAALGGYEGNKAIDATADAYQTGNSATAAMFGIGPGASKQPLPTQPTVAPSDQVDGGMSPSQLALATGAQSGSIGPTVWNAALANRLAQESGQQSPDTTFANSNASHLDAVIAGGVTPATGPSTGPSPTGMPNTAPQQAGPALPMPPVGSTSSPLLIPGMSPQQAFMAYQADPQGYMKALMQRSDNRTDFSKNLLSMGIDPSSQLGRQLLGAWLTKETYIAPTPIRAGGGLRDPISGRITTMPSAPADGFQNVQRPDGSWATVPVAGGTDAITASTSAKEAGHAPYEMVDVYDPTTKTMRRAFVGNVMPLPSSPQGSPQPPQPGGAAPGQVPGRVTPQAQLDAIRDSIPYLQQDLERARSTGDSSAVQAAQRALADAQARLQAGTPWGASRPAGPAARAPLASGGPGVQTGPALGEVQGATNGQNELSAQWTAQQQAHATAQTNVALLQQIRGLADKAVTGYEPDRRTYIKKLGAYLGLSGMDDQASSSDLLNKYGAQLVTGLSSRGMSTDAARDIVMAGTPNSKMQPDAIREASDSLISRELMTQARTRALMPYALSRDPAGYQSVAVRFDQVADPRLWLMRGMTPAQLQRYTQNLSQSDAAALVQKYQAAKQAGFLQ